MLWCILTDPDDYTELTQELTFDSDNTRRIVPVRIVNDNALESIEQFFSTLTVDGSLYPGVTLNPAMANINITDNDGKKN